MHRSRHDSPIQVGDAFYGTRTTDPPAGCVYRTEKDGSGYTVLHIFGGRRGYGPDGLVAIDGALYGVTRGGGPEYRPRADGSAPGHGVVYRLNLDGSGFQVLHYFTRADGAPRGTLAPVGGLLYGTTSEILFRIRPDGTRFVALHQFRFDAAPSVPEEAGEGGGLLAANGVLYGVTFAGGEPNMGTVFRFDTLVGRFQTLHAFSGGDGRHPHGALVLRRGMLYGTTQAGGRHGAGVLFQLPAGGGPLKTLVEFDGAHDASPADVLPLERDADLCRTKLLGSHGDAGATRRAQL